jgi:hypothetical protein
VVYVRTVKTASGATAVQIVHSSKRGSRDIEHLGSAHDAEELEALKAAARQRTAEGQTEFDLGLSVAEAASSGGPLEIASSQMGHLWEALCCAYDVVGFDEAVGGDEVFRQLVLARIIEPTSKEDSSRVLTEVGIKPTSYRTVKRRLPVYAGASGGVVWPLPARRMPRWGRRRWCSATCPRSTSRPTRVTVPGAGVLQGAPAGAADHPRVVHRRRRVRR